MIKPVSHYPYLTRTLISLYADGALTNVRDVEVEPEYGYVAMITYRDGTHRMIRGNDVGLNPAAANAVVVDKAYTSYFLRSAGIDTPKGESFLLGWWAHQMRARGRESSRTAGQARSYIHATTGYPVYVKPVNGSHGVNVWRVGDDDELDRVVSVFERERVRVMLVEEAVDLPDYRLVVVDGELMWAYRRFPLAVTGDGKSTINELLADVERHRDRVLDLSDPRITARLARGGRTGDSVLAQGERLRVLDVSNLYAGGTAVDVTATVAHRWRELAVSATSLFGLRFSGIDLACADIEADDARYALFEINGAPDLDPYVPRGSEEEQSIRDLYRKFLNESVTYT